MNNSTPKIDAQPYPPVIKKPTRFSVIWLLPIIALIICLGLAWNTHQNNNLEITLQVPNAKGIIAGKTHLMYKGIIVGRVNNIHAANDLKKVDITLRVNDKFKSWLTDKTEFWIVKPKVSISGVTDLEALVSGNYIAMLPNKKGKPTLNFTALSKPPSEKDLPGLHISLIADKLHSVTTGSPVYFNQIDVGKVIGYSLQPETHSIKINLVIQPEYEKLVHHNSRFWSASGFDLSANLKGIKVHAESLTTLVKGGIAFYTPTWEPRSALASNEDQFILHNSFEDAQTGVIIDIRFPLLHTAITKDTPIVFHGIKVGHVHRVTIDDDLKHFTTEAIIDPSAKDLLVQGARFSMIRPKVSLSGISDISSFINGPYIAIDASREEIKKGILKTQFDGYENKRYTPFNMPGLNLTLKATVLDGIKEKSPILYKELPIGQVEHTYLGKEGKYIYIDINIATEYQHLINHSSQFKNSGGVSLDASWSGIKFHVPSLTSAFAGGISVTTPNTKGSPIKQGSIVALEPANQEMQEGLSLSLIASNLGSIKMGMPVLYLGIPVGKVLSYNLDKTASHVLINIVIAKSYTHLVTSKSKFWNVSGLKVSGGLFKGIQVDAQSLQTMAMGGIAFATPNASGKRPAPNQRFILHSSEQSK